MWLLALRDLQWRRRRFVAAVLAAATVFGLALVMTGMSASFENEVRRTVAAFDADAWLVPAGTAGPITAPSPFPASMVEAFRSLPGVRDAAAVAITAGMLDDGRNMNILGVVPGEVGAPSSLPDRDVAVVDDGMGARIGDRIVVNGLELEVVATIPGIRIYAGQPALFVPIDVAQRLSFGGQALATVVALEGRPSSSPEGFRIIGNEQVRQDMLKPVAGANESLAFMKYLLWGVAAGIIASMLYMTAIERSRDFAVLKATGAGSGHLIIGMMVQAAVLSATAAALSVAIAAVLAPGVAMSVEIPLSAYILLPAVALGVGALASALAVRRAIRIDPALAFG